jgi:hypothetical protein
VPIKALLRSLLRLYSGRYGSITAPIRVDTEDIRQQVPVKALFRLYSGSIKALIRSLRLYYGSIKGGHRGYPAANAPTASLSACVSYVLK